ncbi:DedA family protein [Bacillus sp. 03113]|uniref:DedA family protein n=1 Tax=Bacillus sp. 03113 TaxID=2578211 RepID=UPI0011417EDA|nr:DedA family protein [Bacillus sp. 03113]
MNIETIMHYIHLYGYAIIFLFLFLGIVGIPAPEESLLFLVGVLIAHHHLHFGYTLLSAFLGAFCGMLIAYGCGKFIGYPFIKKYGRYVGITDQRWQKAKQKFENNMRKTIMFGFYLPGIRQISPYFAGIANVPFRLYFLLSFLGTILWVAPFIAIGYYAGDKFHINPIYVPYVGIFLFVLFVLYVGIKWIIEKRKKHTEKEIS